MMEIPLKLSVLDQSPAAAGESATRALGHTIELAQRAEEWGYHRFWVTEHHGSNRNMGSSPEVLVSHLLARTDHIRVGSGGVMLQHYSPYKVAENFNVLASLAPGRVDLGIGRGPGGMPRTTQALRPQPLNSSPAVQLEEKLVELKRFLGDGTNGVIASPLPSQPADLFLLGTTAASGQMAAAHKLPYVFAMFLNGDEEEMRRAIEKYRSLSADIPGYCPKAMLALPVIVADTDEEVAAYARSIHVVRITLASGRAFTVFSVEAAREFGRQSGEHFSYEVQPANVIHGSVGRVKGRLLEMGEEYGVEEVFIVTAIDHYPSRLHSYELLAEAMLRGGGGNIPTDQGIAGGRI
jgi:luciferase family oxidoreductase group 1